MPPCINDPSTSYTGKEPSPKGRGYCAHASALGLRRKGADGKMYIVTERADRTKYWKIVPARLARKSDAKRPRVREQLPEKIGKLQEQLPEKIGKYDLYGVKIPAPRWEKWASQMTIAGARRFEKLRKMLPTLKADGIRSTIVPLPKDPWCGGYWMDLAWEWGMEKMKYPPVGNVGPAMICILWLSENPALISETRREIYLQIMYASKKQLESLHKKLHKEFGSAFKIAKGKRMIISLL